jgi:DNA-binding transcriptional regulator YdaS (Cro superfamily)
VASGLLLPLLFFAVVLAVMGLSYWYSEAAKIRRALRAARKVAIREATSGEVVRVSGRVRPVGEPLRAPLSQRPCVYFETTVEEYRSSGKSGKWVEIIRETEGMDFLLEDETGKAVVRASEMKVLAVKDHRRESGTFNDAAPDLEAFLARHGKSSTGWIFNKNLRYKEGIFSPGETITVLGQARWEQDPDPTSAGTGYRDVPKRLVLGVRPDGPLLASDEPDLT